MLIDWFTVIAQIFNFLILVWLLKRFLYQPILDAIDAREQRIANALAEADDTKRDAQQERDEFERKNQKFTEEREALVRQMKDDIDIKRQKLLDDAHQAADAVTAKRQEAWQREQKTFEDEIARRTQEQVFSISRKTLQDLADVSLEERITKVFISRVRELSGDAKQELNEALTNSSEPARVRSAFELPTEQQSAIRQALHETFSTDDSSVRFETAPNTIGGIELISNGRKVTWSIDEYLKLLQKSIAELKNPEEPLEEKSEVESELV